MRELDTEKNIFALPYAKIGINICYSFPKKNARKDERIVIKIIIIKRIEALKKRLKS